MKVSFSVGNMSEKIINSLSSSLDNVEFYSYKTVPEMIQESSMRHIYFDRIVFSEKILKDSEKELSELNDYITNYSDNTTIVFVCSKKNGVSDNERIFSELFNSPLYTPVLIDKGTVKKLQEFIECDIQEIRAKYYSLDIKEARTLTVKSADANNSFQEVGISEPEKVGFLKGIFRGKQNKSSKIENSLPEEDSNNDTLNDDKNYMNPLEEREVKSVSENIVNADDEKFVKNDLTENLKKSDLSPSLSGVQNSESDISPYFEDDDFLSLGYMGGQHVDTGFLTEESEEELNSILRSQEVNNVAEPQGIPNATGFLDEKSEKELNSSLGAKREQDVVANKDSISQNYLNSTTEKKDMKNRATSFRMILGERGLGSTSYIVDSSMEILDKEGKNILIVDLDYKRNGILSFIDIASFYSTVGNRGIDKLKVYEEDGIGVLSNGFGVEVSERSLVGLMHSDLFTKYDIVYFDCPLDCIDVLSESLLNRCKILIRVMGNIECLLSTLIALTDRRSIDFKKEDIIFNRSRFLVFKKEPEYPNDIRLIKDICLFSRNNWLSKLS